MKKLFYFFLFTAGLFSQTQNNIWYGFGPYGGTVTEISTNTMGNVASIANGGLSFLYYDWIHMYNAQDFVHTAFLGNSDTLIAADNDSLYWTNDVGYHWTLITPLEKPVNGIRLKKIPQIKFFLWADSTIYTGDWSGSDWQALNPGKGLINDLYVNQTDDQTVIISTANGIFRSSDNGVNWITLPLPSKNYKVLGGEDILPFKLITFADDTNMVYLSSNNGDTWISTSNGLPQGPFELTDAVIAPSGQIFVSASSGVYRTTNFGTNWGPFSDGLEYPDFGILHVLPVNTLHNDGNILYAGTDEGIFEKDPSWAEWAQIGPNNQKCLALGKSAAYTDVILLGTPKGVKFFEGGWFPSNNYAQNGFPINTLLLSGDWGGIALAGGIFPENNGFIQTSTDLGFTWETVFNLPLGSGRFNQFYQRKDSSDIYLALNEGANYAGLLIADVVNDPGNWHQVAGTTGLNFRFSASFPDQYNRIYFLVNDSLLYKSDNGGRSVQYISEIPGGKFNSIYAVQHFNQEQNIYACGQGIKYSSDYGLTRNDYGLDQYEVVRLIYESTSIIAATRANGFFAKYHSAGEWTPFSEGFGKGKIINDALNFTSWVLHAATENHSVYYLWLIINDVPREVSFRSGGFSLSRNYPNPFNPSTSIRYSTGSRQFVTLKVFDLLGREVATLVNEEKPAGTYEILWNAASGSCRMPSGVYFYQIRAGTFMDTKKMILLK